jgi:hypothetical protein
MYEVFDNFLATDTWHTTHSNDEHRFYLALDEVVWSGGFSPDKMAEHMRARCKIPPSDDASGFARSINRLRDNAWAVKDFIKYTQLSRRV